MAAIVPEPVAQLTGRTISSFEPAVVPYGLDAHRWKAALSGLCKGGASDAKAERGVS